ncbi:MAG TPA: ATP-binding protein [Gaiellaceae bacterium]|nr:ATP-binding protein [Gaiellaceae bacterium]
MRRLSLVQRVGLLAAGVAALVGILFVAALLAILSLRKAETRESHSKDVTVATLQVKALSADLESALRGYVLSGNPRFLDLYAAARARVPGDVGNLHTLVHNDPPQRVRAENAAAELHAYVVDYAQNVIVIARISREVAAGQAASTDGKRRIDEINSTLQGLLAAENRRAKLASEHARDVANVAVGIGIAAIIISSALVGLFGAWVARGVARPVRRVAAAAADVAAGDLAVRLEPGGTAEVGALVTAFNSMTGSLEVSRHQLLDQNEQLREGERHKRDLISMVSHELRTPLAAVLGFTALLLERDFPPDEQRRYLEIIDSQARRLAGLAGDFLDVKLLAGGDLTLVRTPFDLVELVREQTELFFLQPASHRLSLDVPGQPLVVDGDRDRLSQVVGNLLSNAIKYSPEDGEVRVSVRSEGAEAVVAVSDDGIGISAEDAPRVFEKFFRAPDAASTVGGTGLGLAVAADIVASHEGTLEVSSTPGAGSTFVLTLPLVVVRAAVGAEQDAVTRS